MTIEINCEARFEAAHRLSFYDGKCNRLHGHNWLVKLRIKSFVEIDPILFDFTHLKLMVGVWDHKVLLKDSEENHILFNALPDDWIVWLPKEPTAENMAVFITDVIVKTHMIGKIKGDIRVEVWENEKSYAVEEETII